MASTQCAHAICEIPTMRPMEPATLYFAEGSSYSCVDDVEGLYRMNRTGLDESVVIVASEPLTNSTYDWVSVPTNHAVVITSAFNVLIAPIHDRSMTTPLCSSSMISSSSMRCGYEFPPSIADCLKNLRMSWNQLQHGSVDLHQPATLDTFQHNITHSSHVLTVCVLDERHVLCGCSEVGRSRCRASSRFQCSRTGPCFP
eukprot:m.238405 g.238405  ORF g.238405 m.238405 type:complete len:200 (-) comp13930_c0_seq32:3191-3790(-)